MPVVLRRSLPPTNSLVVFEAAARHMNFTRAAEELAVTQSAVSRQIQLLEERGRAFSPRSESAEPKPRGLTFDNYVVLIQAALRGEGIALCGRRLAEDFIAHGDLVRPVEEALKSDRGFYLIRPRDAPMSQSARLFHDWLLAEAKQPAPA